MGKQKLELTWAGKEVRPRLEPRILLEDPELSYHAAERVSENDIFDNRLIFGDNLLALNALPQEFAGRAPRGIIGKWLDSTALTTFEGQPSSVFRMPRSSLKLQREISRVRAAKAATSGAPCTWLATQSSVS